MNKTGTDVVFPLRTVTLAPGAHLMEQTPSLHVTSVFGWNVALFAFDPILIEIMINFMLFELFKKCLKG